MYFFLFGFFTFWNGIMASFVFQALINLVDNFDLRKPKRTCKAVCMLLVTCCLPHVAVGLAIPFTILSSDENRWFGFVLIWPYYVMIAVVVAHACGKQPETWLEDEDDRPAVPAEPRQSQSQEPDKGVEDRIRALEELAVKPPLTGEKLTTFLVEAIQDGRLTDEIYEEAKRRAAPSAPSGTAESESNIWTSLKRQHSAKIESLAAVIAPDRKKKVALKGKVVTAMGTPALNPDGTPKVESA
jgi:hypothetical protein